MRGRTIISSARATLGEGLQRWLAAFGQCPSPDRDAGLCTWQYLHPAPRSAAPLAGPLVDDPHLAIGTSL